MLAIRSSRPLTPTGERPALMWLVLLLAGILSSCDNEDSATAEKSSAVVKSRPKPALAEAKPGFDFCNPKLYRFRRKAFISANEAGDVQGQPLPRAALQALSGYSPGSTPFITRFYSLQLTQPNYCAFVLSTDIDDPVLELGTYNSEKKEANFLPLPASQWVSGADETQATDGNGVLRLWHQYNARFPKDTLVEVIERWTVQELINGEINTNRFYIDSITTRFAILSSGSFRKLSRDSIRVERQGDSEKYNGLPRE